MECLNVYDIFFISIYSQEEKRNFVHKYRMKKKKYKKCLYKIDTCKYFFLTCRRELFYANSVARWIKQVFIILLTVTYNSDIRFII